MLKFRKSKRMGAKNHLKSEANIRSITSKVSFLVVLCLLFSNSALFAQSKIIMESDAKTVSFYLDIDCYVRNIDWGDGTTSDDNDKIELQSSSSSFAGYYTQFEHSYATEKSHTIVVDGSGFARIMINVNCNNITYLDITKSNNFIYLGCHGKLAKLDIGYQHRLKYIDCSFSALTSLDISKCPKLEKLDCTNSQLTELDVSNCSSLTSLKCQSNNITKLDCSNCPLLEGLYCSFNPLTNLNVRNCSSLIILSCGGGEDDYRQKQNIKPPLSDLYVGDCVNLEYLHCRETKLKRLDISKCVKLKEITVENCKFLEYLNCDYDRIKVRYEGCFSLSVPNPKGTITINMRNANSGKTVVTPEGFDSGFYIAGENFCGNNYEFFKIEKIKGLGSLYSNFSYYEYIYGKGWAERVAVTPGYGYVARYKYEDYDGKWKWKYLRMYVKREIFAAEEKEGIIGAEIEYVVKEN